MRKMKKYYLLTGVEGKKSEPLASAIAPRGVSYSYLVNSGMLENIHELPDKLTMTKVTVGNRGIVKSDDLTDVMDVWPDFPPSNLPFAIMSKKMRCIIEAHLTGEERVDWIVCGVVGNDVEREYYTPRFRIMPDVLDLEKTLFIDGTNSIIKPVFCYQKVQRLALFTKPAMHDLWKLPSTLYVNERLKVSFVKEGITGVSFSKVPVY